MTSVDFTSELLVPPLPVQVLTRCVPASSGEATDPQRAAPPSPEPDTVVAAGTPPSAAWGLCLHLRERDIRNGRHPAVLLPALTCISH